MNALLPVPTVGHEEAWVREHLAAVHPAMSRSSVMNSSGRSTRGTCTRALRYPSIIVGLVHPADVFRARRRMQFGIPGPALRRDFDDLLCPVARVAGVMSEKPLRPSRPC